LWGQGTDGGSTPLTRLGVYTEECNDEVPE